MTHQPLYLHDHNWSIAFWACVAAMFLHEWWVFSRDLRKVKGERKDRGSFHVIVFLTTIGCWTGFAVPYLTGSGQMPFREDWQVYAAVGVFALGLLLRFWSVVTLGRFFRTTVFVQDDHRLVTGGPYRLIRNPSYTGGLLEFTGLALFQGNWWSLLCIVGGAFLGYLFRIAAENAALRSRFGAEYDAYAKRTWALAPPIW